MTEERLDSKVPDAMRLWQLNGDMATVTRDDLLSVAEFSDRQLTTWITRGLIPRSTRFGQKTGVWPRVVLELVALVHAARARGMEEVPTLQLATVWVFLKEAARDGLLDLGALERSVGSLSPAAMHALPWVVQHVMSAPGGGARPTIRLQTGDDLAPDAAVTIRFAVRRGPDEPAHPLSEVVIALGGGEPTATVTVDEARPQAIG